MARFAPAACSPCAIAHAIERLFATPKTTAVRPFKSSNMKNSPGTKSIRIAGDAVPCAPVVKAFLGERNSCECYSATEATVCRAFIGQHAHRQRAVGDTDA